MKIDPETEISKIIDVCEENKKKARFELGWSISFYGIVNNGRR